MKTIYLDHSATTPVDPEVLEKMLPYFSLDFGNASSLHSLGQKANEAIEEARGHVAQLIGASPNEIIFTSGGTESDNLALRGVFLKLCPEKNHLITSTIEHHAVLHTIEDLVKHNGAEATYVGVDDKGRVNPKDIENAITPKTSLVSIMMANNEIGTIEPIKEIAAICKAKGVLLHTDAVQAIGKIPVDVRDLGVDLLTISAHKFYGPKGVGALYIRKGVRVSPVQTGGAHERNIRSGTYNTPGIVGMGWASKLAKENLEANYMHTKNLRDNLQERLLAQIPDIIVNGDQTNRVPHILNISVKYVEGEGMLMFLDMDGNIQASSGSACTSKSLAASHVLKAMCIPHELINGSIRFSFGKDNTMEHVDKVMEIFPSIVSRLRAMSALGPDKK